MPPKKDDKKPKGPAAVGQAVITISEDDLNAARNLNPLNDFIFANLFAFKMVRN